MQATLHALSRSAILRFAFALTFSVAFAVPSLVASEQPEGDKPPAVGERAPDFGLRDVAGRQFRLEQHSGQGPIVLLVLRGFPGYQCPICSRQVADFLAAAGKFKEHETRVVMIYPGPSDGLDAHAREFIAVKSFPEDFTFLLDPDYTFTDAYALRWDAPRETAYPSTFVLDGDGTIRFAKVSRMHGGRASAREVLDAIAELRGVHGR